LNRHDNTPKYEPGDATCPARAGAGRRRDRRLGLGQAPAALRSEMEDMMTTAEHPAPPRRAGRRPMAPVWSLALAAAAALGAAVTSSRPRRDDASGRARDVAEPAGTRCRAAAAPAPPSPIRISPQRQQLVGVRKATVEPRDLTLAIRTVGVISYDERPLTEIHTKISCGSTAPHSNGRVVIFPRFCGHPANGGRSATRSVTESDTSGTVTSTVAQPTRRSRSPPLYSRAVDLIPPSFAYAPVEHGDVRAVDGGRCGSGRRVWARASRRRSSSTP